MAGGDELERVAGEIAGLREEIRQLREALMTSPSEAFLTTREVADMFRISYETVRRRVADGRWQALIIGRQARFGPEEIAAIRLSLVKRAPESPPDRWERRQRNKRIRAILTEKG
jgi:excisionase family DNA binding protein